MQFVRFQFTNLKGIRDASLELAPASASGGVVTLVGLNESGKTTVLEGIDRFYAGDESEEIKPKDLLGISKSESYEMIPIAERANFNGKVEIAATVRLDDEDVDEIKRRVRSDSQFVITELPHEVKITNRYTFENSRLKSSGTFWPSTLGKGHTKQGTVLHPINSRGKRSADWNTITKVVRERIPMVWYFPNFLFEFPEEVVLTELPNESDSNRLFRSLFEDVLQSLDPRMSIATHIVDRVTSGDPYDQQSLNQLKLSLGAEVTGTVVAQWNALFDSDAMNGKRIFVEIDKASVAGVPDCVVARFLLEDGSELFSIKERSLGFRWFFVYLLLTTYRGRRTGDRNIVFLLDEPASNLHSSAQALLLESVERLSERAQLVYTTHSHHLVNPHWLESTFVVTNQGADPARIDAAITSRKTNIQVTRYPAFAYANPGKQHYFQPVLDVLSYRPSHLELVPEVVMTEGRADFYLLRYYTEFQRSAVEPHLNFLPGRGSASLDTVIQLYLGWGRNFVVLLDSDRGGKNARQHYAKGYGDVLKGRILDLASLGGDAEVTAIESLLSVEDRLKFQHLVDPKAKTWNKRTWSLGVEHAVASRAQVPLSDYSLERLERVVAKLAERLQELRRAGS